MFPQAPGAGVRPLGFPRFRCGRALALASEPMNVFIGSLVLLRGVTHRVAERRLHFAPDADGFKGFVDLDVGPAHRIAGGDIISEIDMVGDADGKTAEPERTSQTTI